VQTQSLIPSFEKKPLHAADGSAAQLFEQLSSELKEVVTLANPMKCDEKYLPFLAYAFKVDFWDETLSVADKRRVIESSLLLHQRKGTLWALERVFEALEMEAEVKEWFEYDAEAYHFKIDVFISDISKKISKELTINLREYVEIYKNVRSILDEINIRLPVALGNIYFEAGVVSEVAFSNEINFGDLVKSTYLNYGLVIEPNFKNEISMQQLQRNFYLQEGAVCAVLLENSDILKESAGVNFRLDKGGVVDVHLKKDNSYKAVADTNINITGGVVWAF